MKPKERVEVRSPKLVEGVWVVEVMGFRFCLPPPPGEESDCQKEIQLANPEVMNPTLQLPPR